MKSQVISSSRPRLKLDLKRVTKPSLTTLSRTLELTAAELGASATVLGTFEYFTYFLPRARTFDGLHSRGVTTAVAFAGHDDETDDRRVMLAEDDRLTRVWAVVLISDSLCGYVYAEDLAEFGDTSGGLESARLFDAEIGFDPARTIDIARDLIDDLARAGLSASAVEHVRAQIDRYSRIERGAVERAWATGMELIAQRLERVSNAWSSEARLATSDPLTGLMNREGLQRWCGDTGDTAVPNPPVGVLLLDLSGFKAVNDSAGHDAGDEMLRGVADAIAATVRFGDLAVRWGGDEFVVVCPGLFERSQLDALGARIAEAVGAVTVAGMTAAIDFGSQVCEFRPLAFDTADAAMYAAKRARQARAHAS